MLWPSCKSFVDREAISFVDKGAYLADVKKSQPVGPQLQELVRFNLQSSHLLHCCLRDSTKV
jgi:hypothetical protein